MSWAIRINKTLVKTKLKKIFSKENSVQVLDHKRAKII